MRPFPHPCFTGISGQHLGELIAGLADPWRGVEHAIAEHKHWPSLQRRLGRRESFGETYLAVAGLVSDRAARR